MKIESEMVATVKKMYANRFGYTDVRPYEVVRKISEKTYEIREMEAVLDKTWKPEVILGGFVGHAVNNREQRWEITSNESNPVIRIRLHKDGYFRDNGGNRYLIQEEPRKFYDYNF